MDYSIAPAVCSVESPAVVWLFLPDMGCVAKHAASIVSATSPTSAVKQRTSPPHLICSNSHTLQHVRHLVMTHKFFPASWRIRSLNAHDWVTSYPPDHHNGVNRRCVLLTSTIADGSLHIVASRMACMPACEVHDATYKLASTATFLASSLPLISTSPSPLVACYFRPYSLTASWYLS